MMTMNAPKNKLHPHKYSLWIAMASITMMFIGFTSAYVVKRSQANWLAFELPAIFYVSTVLILLSSLTIYLAGRQFKARNMSAYKQLITLTALLGLGFVVCQFIGFADLKSNGLPLSSTVSASFIYVIVGAHVLHVLGGVAVLMVMFVRAFRTRIRTYSTIPIEVASTYWHFVGGLWIYLLIFFSLAR